MTTLALGLPSHPASPGLALARQPVTATQFKPTPTTVPRTPTPPAPVPASNPPPSVFKLLAIGLGLYVGWNAPDWIARAQRGTRIFNIAEDASCGASDYATSYLTNLAYNNIDQALRSLPTTDHAWRLPNGYRIKLTQGYSKDGVTYQLTLTEPGGTQHKLRPVKIGAKGGKATIAEFPLTFGRQHFGRLRLELTGNASGLSSLDITTISHEGATTTFKLKPAPCYADADRQGLLRINQGRPADARRWVDAHLAASARAHGGNIAPGLIDLLAFIQPGPDGKYRNHGSPALATLTRALNALAAAGTDMRELERLQQAARNAPSHPAYRQARQQLQAWLQQQLDRQILAGRIDRLSLRNAYGINFGSTRLANASQLQGPAFDPPSNRTTGKPELEIPWSRLRFALTPTPVSQTRDGRLFMAMTDNNPSFYSNLKKVAAVLKVAPQDLQWHEAVLTIAGRPWKGVVLTARQQ